MSEYDRGPLDELARLFVKALRVETAIEKEKLINEWNKTVKQLSNIIEWRW